MILESPKIKSVTVSASICHEVMGPDAVIFVFWMLSFKPTISLSAFTFIMKLFSSSLSVIRVVSSAYLRLWKSKLQKISCVSSIWIRLFQQLLVSNLCVKLQSVCFHSVVPSIFLVRLPSFSSKSQWVIATLLLQTKIKKEIISLYTVAIGEGNGTPLQYSCLENPMDRGAW